MRDIHAYEFLVFLRRAWRSAYFAATAIDSSPLGGTALFALPATAGVLSDLPTPASGVEAGAADGVCASWAELLTPLVLLLLLL